MPRARHQHAAAVMGGKIYASGGYEVGNISSSLVVFDPQANTWTELASMGKALAYHTSAAIGGKLYALGGN